MGCLVIGLAVMEYRSLGFIKLYVCTSAAISVMGRLYSPEDFSAQVILGVTLLMALFGLLDGTLNDVLERRPMKGFTRRWRYLTFIGLAGCQMSLIYASVIAARVDFDTLRYALDGTVAAAAALLDLQVRYRWASRRNAQNHLPAQVS